MKYNINLFIYLSCKLKVLLQHKHFTDAGVFVAIFFAVAKFFTVITLLVADCRENIDPVVREIEMAHVISIGNSVAKNLIVWVDEFT